jgi:uncharacterized protein with HEPN domain
MHPKSPKWLEHIVMASTFILETANAIDLATYERDVLRRSAIERNFEIVGEAMLRLERDDPETVNRLSDYRKVIGFRNRLVHGYDTTDSRLVWEIIQTSLPLLKHEAEQIMADIAE